MALLDRAALLAALAPRTEDVTLPTGGQVRVRTLSAAENIAISAAAARGSDDKIDPADYSARLIAACVVGDDGQRVLTDDDITALQQGAADTFNVILAVVQRLSGMGPSSVEAAKGN
jgi:hypothetical protein